MQSITNALHCNALKSEKLCGQKKSATLNLRIDPVLKEAAREAADPEHRSIANLVVVLIRKHCEAEGIAIPDQQSLFSEDEDG
ncbi:MAG: hypothetical protein U5K56_19420 [Halioglobus sp.]|nr:hypothetical protein [Halioglobus sp.]